MLRVLVAGGDRQKDYIARMAFSSQCRETCLGKVYIWQLWKLLRRNSLQCDLAFIEGRGVHQTLFQSNDDYYLPLWIEGEVDLPLEATNKSAKEDLRRMRKHHLDYELCNDIHAIEDFYHNIYLPTVVDRHGPDTHITDLAELTRTIADRDNQLLLAKQNGVAIAGVVVLMGSCPRLWLGGVRDSDIRYRQMAAVGATYVFPARYLENKGYQRMNVGRSRSFLNDGVLQYKNKWNQRICSHDPDGIVLKPLSMSRSLRSFLACNPFVSLEDDKLFANVFEYSGEDRPLIIPRGLHGTRWYGLSEDGKLAVRKETVADG